MTLVDPSLVDAALKLGLAFLLGLPLGWEREHESRAAGLRTYPLLSAGVCGFLLVALRAAGGPSERADVFYGVLGGIGFVGSGAILRSQHRIRGLTTAVGLWVTGAIGAGVAFGCPLISAAVSLMSALSMWGPWLARRKQGAP